MGITPKYTSSASESSSNEKNQFYLFCSGPDRSETSKLFLETYIFWRVKYFPTRRLRLGGVLSLSSGVNLHRCSSINQQTSTKQVTVIRDKTLRARRDNAWPAFLFVDIKLAIPSLGLVLMRRAEFSLRTLLILLHLISLFVESFA